MYEIQENSIPEEDIPLLRLSRNCFYGFGHVIAEVMSYGVVPVVYNSFEAASGLITDGRNGVLVEKPFSSSGFAGKIHGLIDKPDFLNELSENGRIVSAEFSIDKIVTKWYEIF